jgi:hypothetical protein
MLPSRQMSKAVDNLQDAQQRAIAGRPKVGGFPYLAETLRRAGVTRNLWFLPACQSLYLIKDGPRSMFRHSTGMHLLPRSGPIRPETAAFRSSLRPRGAQALCATMSTLQLVK